MKKSCEEREMRNSLGLPDDVVVDIFLRLSIKNLARLRCVCKSWNDLITSESFVGFHLSKSSRKPRLLFFRYGVSPSYLGFYPPKRQRFENLHDPPFATRLVDLDLLGSCNGVLCFCSTADHSLIYMWNPSNNKYITLPKPTYNPRYLGFGVNSMSGHLDDFKVVTISANANAEVYSWRTNSWKIIDDGFPRSIEIYGSHINCPVFVKGSVHWCARYSCYFDSQCTWLIVSFDFSKGVFHTIMLPEDMSIDDDAKYLNILDGCLCVFAGTVRNSFRAYELWVMKEYGVIESWTRRCIIEKDQIFWWPIGLTRKGKIFVRGDCEHCGNSLLSYDPNTEIFECLDIHLPCFSIQVLTFVDSIITPVPRSVIKG
ncbi:hypothetical protein Patl1_35893 [Pistacia atlantica]|nr:hypothetical protein Patl1_35893 [Pistacia atlantica]